MKIIGRGTPIDSCASRPREKGQSSTETILLLPLYLAIAFGLIQVGLVGVSLVTTTYAAGSIARKAVARNDYNFSPGPYEERFKALLFAGMEYEGLSGRALPSGPQAYTLSVHTCTRVMALPMIGFFLDSAASSGLRYTGACKEGNPPVMFDGTQPFAFIVQGTAKARMNFRSR